MDSFEPRPPAKEPRARRAQLLFSTTSQKPPPNHTAKDITGAPPRRTTPPATRAPLLKKGGDRKEKGGPFVVVVGVRLRATNSAHFSCFTASPLFSLAELADGCELCGKRGQLGFDGGDFLLVLRVAPRFLGGLQGLGRLGLVEVAAADRGVGEHGHHPGLHFEDPARDEDQLFLAAAGRLDPHRARFDARDKRRMFRIDAQFPGLAGKHHELGLARVDARFGADDVDVYRVWHVRVLRSCRYCSDFAFSNASSIAPTM